MPEPNTASECSTSSDSVSLLEESAATDPRRTSRRITTRQRLASIIVLLLVVIGFVLAIFEVYARTEKLTGQVLRLRARSGHIPSAIVLFYDDVAV